MFNFTLSDWQQKAVNAIEDGNHILVTAPTGSGKTVPAEYAIHYFSQKNKKVIYTSPIKALSNQKYFEFQEKFPQLSFGILTGDIKDNPEADVLIMTTEILCNHLHNLCHPESNLEFNIDIQNDLGAVIFDEVHYINDVDRGTVWEECFILLPPQIQHIMLSATIATPQIFAEWVEHIHSNKKVVLCETNIRSVPLKHYSWISSISAVNNIKAKHYNAPLVNMIENHSGTPQLLYSDEMGFNGETYNKLSKMNNHLHNNVFIKRQHVLNQVTQYLKKNQMLPAICFVYSRKNVERFAQEVTQKFIDSTKINSVQKECRAILSRFPNAKEYMALPEYNTLIELLEKGVGIHHSGLLPVFREMIELLFTKGYVQLLFATETFAVGLNMPTKTVLFTSLKKFDGNGMRYLASHEYTQQAGRAGRRGYDTIGHVIHLNNLFDTPTIEEYKTILGNIPQKIVSRFKISYSLVMNYDDPEIFIKNSAIHNDIDKEIAYYECEKQLLIDTCDNLEQQLAICKTPRTVLENILERKNTIPHYKNKALKTKRRELDQILDEHRNAKIDLVHLTHLNEHKQTIDKLNNNIKGTQNYIQNQVDAILDILNANHFTGDYRNVARNIKEVHPLMMTDLFYKKLLFSNVQQMVALFACFTNINVSDEMKNIRPVCNDYSVLSMIELAKERLDHYYNEEIRTNIFSGANYNIHFDLCDECIEWCNCTTEEQCQQFLTKIAIEKNIFLGEFVKAILKINAIAKELEKVCEVVNNVSTLHVLRAVGVATLKSVCTTQSLYV